jgi:hypothetical protein
MGGHARTWPGYANSSKDHLAHRMWSWTICAPPSLWVAEARPGSAMPGPKGLFGTSRKAFPALRAAPGRSRYSARRIQL